MHGSSIALIIDNPTDIKLIDKGAHGAVFRLSMDKCVKIYAEPRNAEMEANTYRLSKGSKIVPKLYEVGDNYIVMEFIEGRSLWKYLNEKKEITLDISTKIISLIREMKRLGFTRIDSSLRHILITSEKELKVIDLVYSYVRKDTKPIKIFTELNRLQLLKQFMDNVKEIDSELYYEWSKEMPELNQ
jgi:putative serine/threonine protein kinase